jgi:hypothetical protein
MKEPSEGKLLQNINQENKESSEVTIKEEFYCGE